MNTTKEDNIMIPAALRFDGYQYAKEKYPRQSDFPSAQIDQCVIPEELLEQLLFFFIQQRSLYKWGGEMLPRSAPDWHHFRELFLLTCQAEIPEQYRQAPYHEQWEKEFKPGLEKHRKVIRRIHEKTNYDNFDADLDEIVKQL